jgi:Zinc carboxypeptidase
MRTAAWLALFAGAIVASAAAQIPTSRPGWLSPEYVYDKPFFPAATYDDKVATPAKILGFELGSRPVTHAEVERCLRTWDASTRLSLHEMGRSHERKPLYYAVITSEANHSQIDNIRAAIGKLADPRKLGSDAEAQSVIRDTPAIAWMSYCVHGDELSGTDAALAVIYHLIAATDDATRTMLDKLVIVVDPLQNPDGRDRFIKMCDESAGYVPNLDPYAIQHAGRWPRGRSNHYLFDMNRDWVHGVQPETRARHAVIAAWNPQLLVDGHEMGHESSFLFNPARDPFNPGLSPLIRKWWITFANASGSAFDRHGWSYYTREWADFWYPGYGDGWATLHGAIGILYEQARTGGRPVQLPTGRILTYREAVHHQIVSTMSNLQTLLGSREAVLSDYLAIKREALQPTEGRPQTFLLPPAANATRIRAFLENAANQGVEIGVAGEAFSASELTSSMGEAIEKREFAAGTIVVQRGQPRAPLVGALLDFDPRMDKAFLDSERVELETKRSSRLYDVTAWSPPLAYGLDAYWSRSRVDVKTEPLSLKPAATATSQAWPENVYAYVISAADDSVVRATAYLLQAGAQVRVAEKEFRAAGQLFPRGSLLIRRHENAAGIDQVVREAASDSGAGVTLALTARSPDDTPDLGGEHMGLLQRPRVALVGDGAGDSTTYGAIWHLLDCEVGLAASLYDAELSGVDLRRFNVIVAVSGSIKSRADDLATWVRSGGTLVAVGGAAGALADEKVKLSDVRRRSDVLKTLEEYASAAALERGAGKSPVDMEKLFGEPAESVPPGQEVKKPETKLTDEQLEDWRKVFSPTGTIVLGELNQQHWITYGCPPRMPLFAEGSSVLLSKPPVQTPVRFSTAPHLRLSGLLWPEAAVRLADSAYLTVERVGNGQVILFAQDPNFRGAWHGTRRLLLNAILLGPGCGASAAAP